MANEVERSRESEENVVSVKESSIYPNPAQEQITLEYSRQESGVFMMEIFDLSGKKFRSEYEENQAAGSYLKKLELNDLPAGEYIIRYVIGKCAVSRKLSKVN